LSQQPEVLYISHNGLTEPLGRRQVLPYIVGLARRGWRFNVLTFEKSESADQAACDAVRAILADADARWTPLRYHRRPPIVSTSFDIARGIGRGLSQVPALVHARSTVAAAIGAAVSGRRHARFIFDVRGLLAREYADAGHWRRGGLLYRMTDSVERRLMRRAHGLVFLTQRIVAELTAERAIAPEAALEVVPCTADLEAFRPDPEARRRIRRDLGLGESKLLVYSGSVGSWYRMEEMAAFVRVARETQPDLHFLVLTSQADAARRAVQAAGVSAHSTVLSLRPERVPEHLAAADAGICFVADLPSKRASSPTKYGEYLATGLPVVTNPWTGDAAALGGAREWILVDELSQDAYRKAAAELASVLARPEDAIRGARVLAEREFGLDSAIDRYDRLYRRVLGARP